MSAVFTRVVRPAILAASRSHRLHATAERFSVTRDVVHRFVVGETVDDAIAGTQVLRDTHRLVSIDYLGEDVTDIAAAAHTVDAYLPLIDALGARAEDRDAAVRPLEVSLKLSALGQALPKDGHKIAYDNAYTICQYAQQRGVWVTVDAEDHTTTDSTLSIVRQLRTEFPWLGTVLQAYLKRTEKDCTQFAAEGARIRLCKGAYDEPSSVAYRKCDDVSASYLRCLSILMAGSSYPMIATHDPEIISEVPRLLDQTRCGADEFEYQMLYGIRDNEQQRLADQGNNVRVYVPFGTQWYGYFVRRLAERPANVTFFLRALAHRR